MISSSQEHNCDDGPDNSQSARKDKTLDQTIGPDHTLMNINREFNFNVDENTKVAPSPQEDLTDRAADQTKQTPKADVQLKPNQCSLGELKALEPRISHR